MKNNHLLRSFSILLISALFLGSQNFAIQAQQYSNALPISLSLVTGGLEAPVHLTHAGDGSGRMFVVEQLGRIRIIENGSLQGVFLDITDRVRSPFSGGGNEEGLLSVAFPPGFGTSAEHFYVYYTRTDGDNRVARFSLSADPDVADPDSEETILDLDHPTNQNHNGGQLVFGPDGYLYIGTGDGGGGGDPDENAQDTQSPLGKLLRIDVESGADPYSVPAGNPFVGNPDYLPEIWGLGLRNPWRFAFDREAGDLYLGDVGQGSWEEVDYQPGDSDGGENYGWNVLEGLECYNAANCDDTGMTPPIHVYANNSDTCAVTGGYVYRGADFPGLTGIYIYADYCSGSIWGLQDQSGSWSNELLLDSDLRITSFGEDEGGELYLTDVSEGAIYRIVQVVVTNPLYLPLIAAN